jgi:hypothetical protein
MKRILFFLLIALPSALPAAMHHDKTRVGCLGPFAMKPADFSGALELVSTNLPPQWKVFSMTESWRLSNSTLRVEGLMAMDRRNDSPFLNLGEVVLSRWGRCGHLLREEMTLHDISLTPWALGALRDWGRGKPGVGGWGLLAEDFIQGSLSFHSAVSLTPLTGMLRYEALRLEYESNAFIEVDARLVGCRDPDLNKAARRLVTNLPNFAKLLKGKITPGMPQPREINLRAGARWTNLNLAAYLDRFDVAQVQLVRNHPALPSRFRLEGSAKGSLKVLALSLSLDKAVLELAPFGRSELTFQARYFLTGATRGAAITGFKLKIVEAGGGEWGWKILATLFRTNEAGARVQAVDLIKRRKEFQKIPAAWQTPLLQLFTVEKRTLVFRLRENMVIPLKRKGGMKDVTKVIVVE